jgi:hypothetical protein
LLGCLIAINMIKYLNKLAQFHLFYLSIRYYMLMLNLILRLFVILFYDIFYLIFVAYVNLIICFLFHICLYRLCNYILINIIITGIAIYLWYQRCHSNKMTYWKDDNNIYAYFVLAHMKVLLFIMAFLLSHSYMEYWQIIY